MQGGQTHLELHRHANAWTWERGELGCSDCWSSSESSDAEVEDQAANYRGRSSGSLQAAKLDETV